MISNTATAYYRFHGIPKLYFSAYASNFLQQVTILILKDSQIQQAYLFLNNTAAAAALDNALFVQQFALDNNKNCHKTY